MAPSAEPVVVQELASAPYKRTAGSPETIAVNEFEVKRSVPPTRNANRFTIEEHAIDLKSSVKVS